MKRANTINGQTMPEIKERLAAPFAPNAVKTRYDGIKYIDAAEIRNRLNEVFTVYGYNEEYPEIKTVNAKNSIAFLAKCRITIFDDEGNVAFTKEMWGGDTIMFPNIEVEGKTRKSEETDAVPNNATAACVDAFKKLCKTCLGIGKADLENAKNGQTYEIVLTSNMREYKGSFYGDAKLDGKLIKLALFKNSVAGCGVDPSNLKCNSTLKVQGSLGKDNKDNDQIIIKKINVSELVPTIAPTTTAPVKASVTAQKKPAETVLTITSSGTSLTSQPGVRFECVDDVGKKGRAIFLQPTIEQLQKDSPEIWETLEAGSKISVVADLVTSSGITQWVVKSVA